MTVSLTANVELVSPRLIAPFHHPLGPCIPRFCDLSDLLHMRTGFAITPEALANAVSEYVNSPAVTGWTNMGAAITALKSTPELRWVNPLELKNAVESSLTVRFGVKEAAKPKGKVRLFTPTGRAL